MSGFHHAFSKAVRTDELDKGGGNGIDADAQASVLDGRVYAYQQCVQSNGRQTVKAERSIKQQYRYSQLMLRAGGGRLSVFRSKAPTNQ